MLGVFITYLGEIGVTQWSSDQMREGNSMCLRWLRSMCWTEERHSRSSRKMEKTGGRTQVVLVLPRCNGYRWRSNWIRVEIFPRIFIIVCSWKNPTRLGEAEDRARGVHRPDHLHVNVQWTLYGTRMMRTVFRMPKKSRITQWDSQKDIGHSWVQARKRSGMEVLTTLRKGNGIAQPRKWCNGSKKLVIQNSKVSVPWVVESWSTRKVKPPLTSTEILWTQNSCSKQFITWISSVFTEQWRTGVTNLVRQKKRRDEPVLLWTTRFWPSWNLRLLVSPPTPATGNRMQERVLSFDDLAGKIQLIQLCAKTYFLHLVAAGKQY